MKYLKHLPMVFFLIGITTSSGPWARAYNDPGKGPNDTEYTKRHDSLDHGPSSAYNNKTDGQPIWVWCIESSRKLSPTVEVDPQTRYICPQDSWGMHVQISICDKKAPCSTYEVGARGCPVSENLQPLYSAEIVIHSPNKVERVCENLLN